MIPQKILRPFPSRDVILLPLRLFLGITFVYAGIQKVTDPQFFDPKAIGYIGKQMARFSVGSPIGWLMTHLVPHAPLIGIAIIVGEVAIGLGTLFGFLFRPGAFFGLVLSLSFFLTASWHTYPYFYGADIVFVFAWMTLILSGPLHSGYPTLDEYIVEPLLARIPLQLQREIAPLFALVLGITIVSEPDISSVATMPHYATQQGKQGAQYAQGRQGMQQARIQQQRKQSQVARIRENRRNFILGAISGAVGGLAMFGFASILFRNTQPTTSGTTTGGTTGSTTTTSSGTTTSASGNVIAQVSAVPKNSSATFTIPSNGDPGVLVHLNNDQFVAFDATCTHAGCPVSYDPASQLLQCPCHGAAFDPAKNAEVVNPPAQTPLTAVQIHVDSTTGAITIVGA